MFMKKTILLTLVLLTTFLVLRHAHPVAAEGFAISPDGQEVTDNETGLIWRRCAEGAIWNGISCEGVARTFTHEQANTRAASMAATTGHAWRLPNMHELLGIANPTLTPLAIDARAFPETPPNRFWTSTFLVREGQDKGLDAKRVMYVHFGKGGYLHADPAEANYVRLVRSE
jgi:Protein of unknown function (DUF1566)